MARILAFDLDDTLLFSDGTFDGKLLPLFRRWLAEGNHIVIATGRPTRMVSDALPPLLQSAPWISYNGAEAHQKGRKLFEDLIPLDDACTIVRAAQELKSDWRLGVEMRGKLYLNREGLFAGPHACTADLLSILEHEPAKIIVSSAQWKAMAADSPAVEAVRELGPLLQLKFPGTRPMLSERYRMVQFMSVTADKSVALARVVEMWGCTMQDVIAFGDDVNDVEMIRQAGCGVAVANAVQPALDAADFVTASNDEGGVRAVVEKLVAGEWM